MDKKKLDQQSQYWEKNFSNKPEMFGLEPSIAAVKSFKLFKEANIKKYSRQLHAYALALEKAAEGKPALSPITKIGLFVVEPEKLLKNDKLNHSYPHSWRSKAP